MTVIAICKRFIAADGQTTAGSIILSNNAKKLTVCRKKNVVYATSGCVAYAHKALQLHRAGKLVDPHAPSEYSWELVVLRPDGTITTYTNNIPHGSAAYDLPFATGSGGELALGAMLAGASAVEAVEVACRADIYSGGKATKVEYKKVFAKRK